ncbi:MAG: hypothetical protein JNL43_11210 [Flavobacteriales bacterium]|nr:hypothetical protein [Flavobacteriales bacterium]HRH69263.1 hypothetical protein [Flavobacteriales bacterium]
MDQPLSRSDREGVQRYLDRAEVLQSTVDQLRKDLSLVDEALPLPAIGETAFEALRAEVLVVLQRLASQGDHALKVAMYRIDIPEPHLRRTLARDGLFGLAGEVVLRALQKVLTRWRYAGRF